MTTPRTSQDYAECKRQYAEQQLASGKGMPTRPAGPRLDMPDEPQLPSCGCCSYWVLGAVTFALSLTIMAAGAHAASHRDMPAASHSLTPSSNCVGWGGTEPPAPFTSLTPTVPPNKAGLVIPPCPAPPLAVTNAVATVNVAVNQAAAALMQRQAGREARLLYMREYIAGYTADSDRVALLLYNAGTAGGVDPLLLMCVARYESTFDIADIGGAGERGLLQVHPCHKRAMRRAGLDWYSEHDRLAFACTLIAAQGLKPWSVRRRALALYERLTNT